MSLLDTDEYIKDEQAYRLTKEIMIDSQFLINLDKNPSVTLLEADVLSIFDLNTDDEKWIKFSLKELSAWGAFDSFIIARLDNDGHSKISRIRMQNGLSKNQEWNRIEFYFRVPEDLKSGSISLLAETKTVQDIFIKDVIVTALSR